MEKIKLSEDVLPFNEEAEQSVLGSIFLNEKVISEIAILIKPDDFYFSKNRELYRTILKLRSMCRPIDIITISEQLKSENLLGVVGIDYVAEVINTVPTSSYASHYAEIVRDKSILRNIIKISNEIKEICYKENEKIEDIMGLVEKKLSDILQKSVSKNFVHIKYLLEENLDRYARLTSSQNKIVGLPTGFNELDNITSGFQASDLILVAARPAMGKTSFALNIAQFAAVYYKACIAIFSLEMPAIQIANRILSSETGISSIKLKNGDIKDKDWEKIGDAMGCLCKTSIHVDDTSGVTVFEISSKCKSLISDKGLDLVVIDYLQLMRGVKKNENRHQEISEITRSLKILARELNVPIVLLSQLSRAPEIRTDHRPTLSDLRESGAIEQDADIVLFLYREDYYNKECEERNVAECIISKHRNGELGTIKLKWSGEITKFSNWSGNFE
ncbi:MAG: replicative DNA helicase [Clostridiales bacterium]|nr:replicative DNA helicase [Clostridiales bacterium]